MFIPRIRVNSHASWYQVHTCTHSYTCKFVFFKMCAGMYLVPCMWIHAYPYTFLYGYTYRYMYTLEYIFKITEGTFFIIIRSHTHKLITIWSHLPPQKQLLSRVQLQIEIRPEELALAITFFDTWNSFNDCTLRTSSSRIRMICDTPPSHWKISMHRGWSMQPMTNTLLCFGSKDGLNLVNHRPVRLSW